jgi:crotonobetainyl-CoA:carnitine CoA-transferase CaiB-like acyl-CoA transferase
MHLPLAGITVLEFTHAVMGPTAGLILADLGAEVIHVEPPDGDATRRLKGFGTGYFPFYSRNKRSLAIDIKSEAGKNIIYQLTGRADIVLENFGPGTMNRLGYGFDQLKEINPRLIYCSLKGFLKGPYGNRHAMDEVVQMMGGLAYMTGRPGDPLRAGTSVIDITGGLFGCLGILTALYERERTGVGKWLEAALFETTAFLMGQHMAYGAITREAVPPMPARVSAWSIYRIFETQDEQQIFIGIISDKHWTRFCESFRRLDWLADVRLATNNDRILHREWFLPEVEKTIRSFPMAALIEKCEQAEIPFSPIARPEDLFHDPHLRANGSLLETMLPDGSLAPLPKTPIAYGDARIEKRSDPPSIGQDNEDILLSLGLDANRINQLISEGIISGKNQN